MSSLSLRVPNLIGGVSQQPEHLRKDNQSTLIENCRLSVAEGCDKRWPTNYVKELIDGAGADTWTHFIDRDAVERYVVTNRHLSGPGTGDLKVFGLADGKSYQVKSRSDGAPDFTYLNTATPSEDLVAVTIADYTFIVNRSVQCKMDSLVSDKYGQSEPGSKNHIAWWVRQSNYDTVFKLRFTLQNSTDPNLDGTWQVSYTSAASPNRIDTNKVALELFNLLNVPGPNLFKVTGGVVGSALNTWPGAQTEFTSNFTALRDGNMVLLRDDNTYTSTRILDADSHDGLGGDGLVTMFREVPRFTELPTKGLNGQILKVTNNDVLEEDDYYVRFFGEANNNNPVSDGYWAETIAPGVEENIDLSEAPHVLIRTQDDASGTVTGTPFEIYFQFGEGDWEDRLVGDDTSNKAPSWAPESSSDGVYINDIFFHKNRLGMVADDNVILSQAGNFFNFWRTSTRLIKDADRIDVGAAHRRVSIFRHAVPYQERLLCFTDRTVFVLDGSPILTPKTVELTPVLEYESRTCCSPEPVGSSVFFAFNRGDSLGVRELFAINPQEAQYDSTDATAEVPYYIPTGDMAVLAGSSSESMLTVMTAGERSALYVFNFYWLGTERVQSAWHKWDFANGGVADVYGAQFIGKRLYVVVQHESDGLFLEYMDVGDGLQDGEGADYVTLLDQRLTDENVDVTVFYNSGLDRTEYTLPYTTDNRGISVVRRWKTGEPDGGEDFAVVTVSSTVVAVAGNISTYAVWIGVDYTQDVAIPDPVVKDRRDRPVAAGDMRVKRVLVNGKATQVRTRVEADGRAASTKDYTVQTGSGLGAEFSKRFAVAAKNPGMSVRLQNLRPFPAKLLSAEWETEYANSASR